MLVQFFKKRSARLSTPFFFQLCNASFLRFRIAAATITTVFLCDLIAQDAMPSEPNSIVYSKSAAAIGKSHYLINCQQCHDADGRALANIDYIAADLTAPNTWYYGESPLHIFRSIKFGAGLEMPPFEDSLEDEIIWQIVAHILNIGPKEMRPSQE